MAESEGPSAVVRRVHTPASQGRESLGVLGISLLITWSFLFWNGPLLAYALRAGAQMDALFLGQGLACAFAALAFVLTSHRVAHTVGWFMGFGLTASCASLAVALGWVADLSNASSFAFSAFCLSGLGSALFLCWQEYLSVKGVAAAAVRLVVAYILAGIEFLVVSALPVTWVELVSMVLPLASFACAAAVRGGATPFVASGTPAEDSVSVSASTGVMDTLRQRLAAVPWRLPVIVAIAHFCYGVTRVGGIVVDGQLGYDASNVLGAAVPIVCCLLGAVLAYAAYRLNATAGLYMAFPMLALGCLLDSGVNSWSAVAAFGMVNVGAELIRFLTWFLMIDVIVKDGASALLCAALLRVAHWGGCTLGQGVSLAVGDGSMMASVAVLLLMMGLFALLGTDTLFARQARDGRLAVDASAKAKGEEKASGVHDLDCTPNRETLAATDASASRTSSHAASPRASASNALQRRVERTARECALSPRETEVLAIWVTGRTASYIEKVLFISRSTVKTHLTHIYAKTCTSNREELIELVNDH